MKRKNAMHELCIAFYVYYCARLKSVVYFFAAAALLSAFCRRLLRHAALFL